MAWKTNGLQHRSSSNPECIQKGTAESWQRLPRFAKVRQNDLGPSCSFRTRQGWLCSAAWAYTCLGSVLLPPLLPLPGIVHPHYPPAGQGFLPSAQRSHKNSVLWACLITRGLKIKAFCSGTRSLCKAKVTIMAGEVLVHSLAVVRAQLSDLKLPSIKK